MSDDRPTLAERYALATQTSDLKMREGRCAADYLVAAGWVPGTLGSLLHRLRGEFDLAKQEVRGTGANAETERLLALMHLKSLPSARDGLAAWGSNRATFKGYTMPDRDLFKLIGRALDVWLDPLCSPCDGRGYTGGGRGEHSGPRVRCSTCGETGRRKQRLGKDDMEREFAQDLLAQMDRMVQDTESQMARFLRSGA